MNNPNRMFCHHEEDESKDSIDYSAKDKIKDLDHMSISLY